MNQWDPYREGKLVLSRDPPLKLTLLEEYDSTPTRGHARIALLNSIVM